MPVGPELRPVGEMKPKKYIYEKENKSHKTVKFHHCAAVNRGGGGDESMSSAVALAYMGVWELSTQWGPGARPLVGARGTRPPEAGDIF